MGEDSGEVNVYNTARQEAEKIVFPFLEGLMYAISQGRTGKIKDVPIDKISSNQKKINRVKALHLIISYQKDLVQYARSKALAKSMDEWTRKIKETERGNYPFNEADNDYNKLIEIKEMLNFFDLEIRKADKSATKDDDFLIESQGTDGMESELTQNFYEMFNELEDTSEKIDSILIRLKIVAAGFTDDESASYKELEEEGKKRIVEA